MDVELESGWILVDLGRLLELGSLLEIGASGAEVVSREAESVVFLSIIAVS